MLFRDQYFNNEETNNSIYTYTVCKYIYNIYIYIIYNYAKMKIETYKKSNKLHNNHGHHPWCKTNVFLLNWFYTLQPSF